MSGSGLHLPNRLKVSLATRVFYRADGSLFGVQTVPENIATVCLPDLTAVGRPHAAQGEQATVSVPVLTFIKMSITLTPKGQTERGRITMFVEEPQAEPGVIN